MYNIIASLVPRNPQNEAAFICPGNVIRCYTLHNQYTVRFNTACAHCAVITTCTNCGLLPMGLLEITRDR